MVIDKPQCGLDTCKYYFDGNCTNEKRYRTCEFAYLKTLEATGRLIELPCKVGDTVYALENVFDDGKDCSTAYIAAYELFEIAYDGENLVFSGGSYTFGENVFLTKEEAEAKLAELKGEK